MSFYLQMLQNYIQFFKEWFNDLSLSISVVYQKDSDDIKMWHVNRQKQDIGSTDVQE